MVCPSRRTERFACPGAWGVTWEDLVELSPNYVALWEELARAFLTWCRRGVDGFRCDAGYKVPVRVWQYIEARVRQEFPQTFFSWKDWAARGSHGIAPDRGRHAMGLLGTFPELRRPQRRPLPGLLPCAKARAARAFTCITAKRTTTSAWPPTGAPGRSCATGLCALTSVSGGFGFTCGVEWLAAEKINVHSSRGLSWGNPDNLLAELAQLNHLLAAHPCFFDGAVLTRLSRDDSPVFALRRDSAEGLDHRAGAGQHGRAPEPDPGAGRREMRRSWPAAM